MRLSRPVSFRTRLTLRWTAVFSCILAAASVAIYLGIRSASYADLDRHLRTLAGTEVASAFDQPRSPHVHDVPAMLDVSTITEKLVQVFDASGELVVASDGRAQTLSFVSRDLIAAGLAGEAPLMTVDADGLPIRLIVLRGSHDGGAYAFAVGVVISRFHGSLDRIKWMLLVVWVLSTVATAAAGFALASTALGPVRHITQRSLEIASSNLSARLEAPTVDDEIGAMTRALNTLLERLQQALDANRRFAADAAHELRSPVTAMAGEIDVALRRERTAGEYRETLALVRERLSSLSAVTNELMLLVRAQETAGVVTRRELAVEALVQESVTRCRAMAEARRILLSVRSCDGLLTYGDAGLLGRVLDNVIENAIRYNRDGGTVSIAGAFADSAADSWEPGRVTLRIADSGLGIPPAERDRVFDRFYRVDASRNRHTGGAGLGLAIAREVLALFQGTIRIERSSDAGTVVAIELPGRARAPGDRPGTVNDVEAAADRVHTAATQGRPGSLSRHLG